MTAIIPALILVIAVRVVYRLLANRFSMIRRRRPFRLAPAWYAVEAPGRHRVAPDPGRDWVVA